MNSGQIDGRLIRLGMDQLMGLVMVFPVLIGEFKLRASFRYERFLPHIKLSHLSYPVRAMVIAALVEGDLFFLFPSE